MRILLFMLQQSINASSSVSSASDSQTTDLQCRIDENQEVNCSSHTYKSRSGWRTSRALVNEQIRRLRAQLFELKVLMSNP